MGQVGKNLKDVIVSFAIVLGDLLRKHPLFFFISLTTIGTVVYFLFGSDEKIVIFLCILITLTSFILYMYKDSYTEAFLTFFLGILTIFTIQWDDPKTLIFIISYFVLNAVIFIGGSIKLAAKVESILKRAAAYNYRLDIDNQYKVLKTIADKSTNFHQLRPVERAEIIDFMCFIKVSTIKLYTAINKIETIKVLTRSDLTTSLNLYKALYMAAKRLYSSDDDIENYVQRHLDNILRLTMTPDEIMNLFGQTKKYLIQRKIELVDYYEFISRSRDRGLSEDEIAIDMEKIYNR
jgi:hypothetical protein